MEKLKVEDRKTSELIPYARNARQHSPEQIGQIAGSIREFGFLNPVLIDGRAGIIAGHGRVLAAQKLGLETVPCIEVRHLTDAQRRAFILADNRIAEAATWNPELLKVEMMDLSAFMEDLTLTGFGSKEIDELLQRASTRTGNPDDKPDTAASVCKTGDTWVLGDHRLRCGDSTKEDDVLQLLQGKPVALVLTDPPYAIYGSSSGIGSDISDDKMVRPFFLEILRLAANNLKNFGHCYVCCDWRSWPSWWEMAKRVKLSPKNLIVWDKGGGGLGSSYANAYELVGFFAKLPAQHVMTSNEQSGQRQVHQSNIWRGGRVNPNEKEHNAQKPVALMTFLLENSSDRGDHVLEPFGGSGTTLIACEETGRCCRAMEIDEGYCSIIISRWMNLTGKTAYRIEDDGRQTAWGDVNEQDYQR